jgi:hypothetical protein
MDTSRVWLLDASKRISAAMENRIAPTDPTKMTASLFRHLKFERQFVLLIGRCFLFPGPPVVDDKMNFRIFRRSRYHVIGENYYERLSFH